MMNIGALLGAILISGSYARMNPKYQKLATPFTFRNNVDNTISVIEMDSNVKLNINGQVVNNAGSKFAPAWIFNDLSVGTPSVPGSQSMELKIVAPNYKVKAITIGTGGLCIGRLSISNLVFYYSYTDYLGDHRQEYRFAGIRTWDLYANGLSYNTFYQLSNTYECYLVSDGTPQYNDNGTWRNTSVSDINDYVNEHNAIFSVANDRIPFTLTFNNLVYTPSTINQEVLPVMPFVFQMLSMPFTFLSGFLNFTFFEGTPYAFNLSVILLSLSLLFSLFGIVLLILKFIK